MSFKEIKPEELKENPFTMIGKDWLLITAGTKECCNTMTASWGGLGVMWGKPSATVYIRQSRYTKEFVDKEEYFTISVMEESYREALKLCGTVSGRECDKMKEVGISAFEMEKSVGISEARIVMLCKKQYCQFMGPEGFTQQENDEKWYGDKDYHTMYIASVEKVFIKEA
ncbi:Flavoredoxin [uncultured Roseburia sp.]|uniref:Flavin reductase n=1 Tax=Brotonthovivens ammoniilytica TaxID=2981725 RepID=A0ABT2TM27_9FIRM|nr:flavin reductase [Brotonthovivens ammoniilytica]MCU6763206.1 flavin reductase [Brotonthovivens ammoniilytica]SCJ06753.1 Flavoredoxin [uncultured Roseburia sp.]